MVQRGGRGTHASSNWDRCGRGWALATTNGLSQPLCWSGWSSSSTRLPFRKTAVTRQEAKSSSLPLHRIDRRAPCICSMLMLMLVYFSHRMGSVIDYV